MTVGTQVKQTLSSLKSARWTLQNFASIEENREAKDIFSRNAQLISDVIQDLENRVGQLEFEEPQYKGF